MERVVFDVIITDTTWYKYERQLTWKHFLELIDFDFFDFSGYNLQLTDDYWVVREAANLECNILDVKQIKEIKIKKRVLHIDK